MTTHLDHAEQAGRINVRFTLECMEIIRREANTALSFLLAGGGASLAYAIKLFTEAHVSAIVFAILGLSIYFFVLAAFILQCCLKHRGACGETNEPKVLYQKKFELDKIREVDLGNLQSAIDENRSRADQMAASLNKARLAAILSPAVFLLAWVLSWFALKIVSSFPN